jgi:protease-4
MFRKTVLIVLALVLSSTALVAQVAFPAYYSNDFQLTSPGAMKFGLYGFDNPATLNDIRQPDLYFTFTDQKGKWSDFNRWGVFTAVSPIGFGFIHQKLPDGYVTDYRLSIAGGSRAMSVGYSLGWSHGETRLVDRSGSFSVGVLSRPNQRLSVGLVGSVNLGHGGSEGVADIAVRPLGTEVLALFADYAIQSKQSLKNGGWSMGAATEVLPGVRLTGRYFDTKAFTLGFQFSLGNIGIGTQAHYDTKQNYGYNSYAIRIGGYDRTVLRKLADNKNYLSINMIGTVKYQRFMLFDNSKTLAELLSTIDAAKEDASVSGIAINTSGMNVNNEMLWELREKLKDFKSTGKHVVVFVDRVGITAYHFASVADKIVMDSQGTIMLEGFVTGRTFLKGTFEKLGLGYDEWRFFKYKSAVENFSRDKMSDADREQRQNLINDYYKTAKNDICAARGIPPERFDNLVNNETIFLPQDALARGLVDTVGRWETVQEVIKKLEGDNKRYVGRGSLMRFNLPTDNHWGERPRIAVIYALGVCDMDQGIRARSLVHDVEAAVNDHRVKAIVLRVDSPGGDAMASDYIAEAMKKAKGKKPVIVSQGAVAGSGGYWLSMYADTIVAAPQTITGSIGVIGGWIYDNGLKQKLGLTTDLVKAGEHSDLGFGFVLPYIGAGIPDRNLTEAERVKMEATIRSLYKDFVGKVATGRSMKTEDVERIGEGHFYSGIEGKRIGLVDLLGGLESAVSVAKERAGIRPNQEVSIVELPVPGLFDFGALIPKFFGVEIARPDPVLEHLKFRLKNNGIPMPLLPFEEIDFSREQR